MKKAGYRVRIVTLVEVFDDVDGQARRAVLDLTDARTRMLFSGPQISSYLVPATDAERLEKALGEKYARVQDPENGLI